MTREHVYEFLKSCHPAALATVGPDGLPYVATIYFIVDQVTGDLFFVTKDKTQKCMNIRNNPNVALAITDAHAMQTVQIHGTAVCEIESAAGEIAVVLEKIAACLSADNIEQDLPLLHSGDGTLMLGRVTPKKIRWADFRNAGRGVDPFVEV